MVEYEAIYQTHTKMVDGGAWIDNPEEKVNTRIEKFA